MSSLPRLSLLLWAGAAAAAAAPTWEEWQYRLEPHEYQIHSCIGTFNRETSVQTPLRGDLDHILQAVGTWGVPAILVLVALLGCLAWRDPRSVGVRAATVLGLIAVVTPFTPAYSDSEGCGTLPLLSADWFATAMSSWGSTQVWLLTAAGLVLLASRTMRTADPVRAVAGLAWRRLLAILVDYLLIIVILMLVVGSILSLTGIDRHLSFRLENGLLNWINLERLVILPAFFLYFWVPRGRTPGKLLLGLRVVSAGTADRPTAKQAALRALIFPLLAFVPFILIADGLWALLDPGGRPFHDRWAGTEVVRRTPRAGRSDEAE